MNRYQLNETHDVQLKSWVTSANQPGNDFPVQNLPFAIFRRNHTAEQFRGGVAIGDQVVDLAQLYRQVSLNEGVKEILSSCIDSKLNRFMQQGPEAWSALRLALSRLLRAGAEQQSQVRACLIPQSEVEYDVPCMIGDYTDFYTSIHHATNVGALFRPDNPLLPNYKWIPIGYHGRSSSIAISGQQVHRPNGQTRAPDQDAPQFGPCKRLDFELELGIYLGQGNDPGVPVKLDEADDHVFGYCLFNDWSARDIQAWEYVPLGPFLSKNFASTISPWIVTNEAVLPFRQAWTRDEKDPQPLEYLESASNRRHGAIDIRLQVALQSDAMREQGLAALVLSRSSFASSYWTVNQMVAHHTVNGCNLRPGDFFGSGTQSGPAEGEMGSLLEISAGGKKPFELPTGETRTFLEDGDSVIMQGYCEKQGAVRIGFGEAVATVVA